MERFGDALEVHRETLLIDARAKHILLAANASNILGIWTRQSSTTSNVWSLMPASRTHVGLGVLDDLREDHESALEHFGQALLLHLHHEDTLLMMAMTLKIESSRRRGHAWFNCWSANLVSRGLGRTRGQHASP